MGNCCIWYEAICLSSLAQKSWTNRETDEQSNTLEILAQLKLEMIIIATIASQQMRLPSKH